jgi:hypothetical protein
VSASGRYVIGPVGRRSRVCGRGSARGLRAAREHDAAYESGGQADHGWGEGGRRGAGGPEEDGGAVGGTAGSAESGHAMPGSLAGLGAAVVGLDGLELGVLRDRDLVEHAVALDRLIARLEGLRARALREIDQRQAFTQDACVSVKGLLVHRTRRDPARAAALANAAIRVGRLPELGAAWEAGEVSSDHVGVIVRAAVGHRVAVIADHEETLVELARTATPREVAVACRRLADAADRDANDRQAEEFGGGPDVRRELTLVPTVDGMGQLWGTLDQVTYDLLKQHLGAHDTPAGDESAPDGGRTAAQRRHDAFHSVLVAAADAPATPRVHGYRPRTHAVMDLMTLVGRDDLATRRPRLVGTGEELSVQRALEIAAQGTIVPVLSLGPWRPMAFGRSRRVLPAWLRPMLFALHRTCVAPGCDAPAAWSQAAHSSTPYGAGGTTDFDHTLPFCPKHHDLVDEGGWTCDWDPTPGPTRGPRLIARRSSRPPRPIRSRIERHSSRGSSSTGSGRPSSRSMSGQESHARLCGPCVTSISFRLALQWNGTSTPRSWSSSHEAVIRTWEPSAVT